MQSILNYLNDKDDYSDLSNREFLDRWHDEDKGERLNHFGLIITRQGQGRSYEQDKIYPIR